MTARDPNAIRRDAHGRFATTEGIISELAHTGQADLSSLAVGKNFVNHITLSRTNSGRGDMLLNVGIKVGSVTGRVPFQIAQKNFSVDIVDRLISRIDVGSKLRSLITPNVKKLARASHYKFYNVFWRQVSKVAPILSEVNMAYEINCADSKVIEEDAEGLIWKDILPEGTLAISPGGAGRAVSRPLVVVGGKSPNPRVAIGLTDIKEAFEKGAFKHVTVPTTHANKLEENQGFIRKLRIDEVDGKRVLRGGFDLTEPAAKEKVKNGTWADCSVGLVYDRVDKTTGEKFPIALEHVNLTNQPWVTRGMGAFGLSDEEGDRIDAADLGDVEILEFSTATAWAPEQSTAWRTKELEAELLEIGDDHELIDVGDGVALVREPATGAIWAVPYSVSEGDLTIHEPDYWQKAEVPDFISTPTKTDASSEAKDKTVIAVSTAEVPRTPGISDEMAAAQDERRRVSTIIDTPEGGVSMDPKDITNMSEDELRAEIVAAREARAKADADKQKAERKELVGKKVDALKELGLSEHPGLLKAFRQAYIADVGGPAGVMLSEENPMDRQELSLSEVLDTIVAALPKDKNDKVAFGETHQDMGDKGPAKKDETGKDLTDEERFAAAQEFFSGAAASA